LANPPHLATVGRPHGHLRPPDRPELGRRPRLAARVVEVGRQPRAGCWTCSSPRPHTLMAPPCTHATPTTLRAWRISSRSTRA